jgi:hypothetical protein
MTDILNRGALVDDLKLATEYAARVGLLQDEKLLERLQRAEQDLQGGDTGVHQLAVALNDVVRCIAPITLADLRFGRDPLSSRNQHKARMQQLWLTLLALFTLGLVGYFMQSLRIEQDAIKTLVQIQELNPQQKLTALRRLAQFEHPLEQPSAAQEMYHQRAHELKQINSRLLLSYNGALAAAMTPLFPTPRFLLEKYLGFAPDLRAEAVAADPVPEPPARGGADPGEGLCAEEGGGVKLPAAAARYPAWMRSIVGDNLSEFCFQLKVLAPDGDGALLNDALAPLAFLPEIRHKIALRLEWFLPFFYGVLGSVIFALRNVSSVRTPSVDSLPVLMRIALGGVAGIVIGWFGTMAVPGDAGERSLSIPLALAFLTGYGIELLFSVLDKLILGVSAVSWGKKA